VLPIVAAAGTTVCVGEVIASVGSGGAAPPISERTADAATAPAADPANGEPAGDGRRTLATPLARRLAATQGIALAGLHGTGARADHEGGRAQGRRAPDAVAPPSAAGCTAAREQANAGRDRI
jgi:pyruvate/2-oxoglutarate dehydrogenase complex dihydrolipoamide acyltransferase (E2) component